MLRFSKSLKVAFEKCYRKCECITSRCAVNGLMKCTVCNDILKSAFGKKGCVKDGKKPAMIKPAARSAKKKLFSATLNDMIMDFDKGSTEDSIKDYSSDNDVMFEIENRNEPGTSHISY